jgi:hypothetical protein
MLKTVVYLKVVPLFLFACIILVSTANAGESDDRGTIGISAAFGSGSVSIMTPIWTGRTFVLVPTLGVVHRDRVPSYPYGAYTADNYAQVHFDVLFRFNLAFGEAVPYIGFRLGAINTKTDDYIYYDYPMGYRKEKSYTDGLFGLAAGGEYFLKERLSIGVEGQLNLELYDSESRALRQYYTRAVVIGTFYF